MKQTHNKHHIIIPLFTLLVLLSCFIPAFSAKAYTVTKGQYVYDDANLLDSDSVRKLNDKIKEINKEQNTYICIVTTSDDEGLTPDEYADTFYDAGCDEHGVFPNDTIILLIDMDARKVTLNSYGRFESIFDLNHIHKVTDKTASYLKKSDYYNACNAGLDEIVNQLDPHRIYFDLWFQVVVSIVVSGIIVAIIAFSRKTPITTNSNTYLDQSKSHLRFHHDNYIRTVVTKQKKPSNNNNSSGSGHSSSGPSGHSHSSGSSSF